MKKNISYISLVMTFGLFSSILQNPTILQAKQEKTLLNNHVSKMNLEETLNDDPTIDSVLVILKNEDNIKNRDYGVKDFAYISAVSVTDLSVDSFYSESHMNHEDCVHPEEKENSKILKIQLKHGGKANIINAIKKLERRVDVISAEPNYKGRAFVTTPTDVNLTTDWYIKKIELDKAWDITTGLSEVKVGVIDTGIDGNHLDLTNRVDRILSKSYSVNSSNALSPEFYHGTWVAGIIGAQGNNTTTGSGVNWNVSLVSLRADGSRNGVPASGGQRARDPYEEDMAAVISSINYAKAQAIPILNFSGGFDYNTDALQTAVNGYTGLLVCAAGNSGVDISALGNALYPSTYTNSNIIAVGATSNSDTKSSWSNYSKTKVHLFAPGENLRGANMGGGIKTDSGTSGSAPVVAGVAALIKSVNPGLTTAQIKSAILNNVDIIPELASYCITGGRVNAYKAIKSVIPEYQTTELNSPTSIPAGNYQWYKYSIGNGTYIIETTGNLNTIGYLYPDALVSDELISSSSGGSGNNFAITYTSTSVKTIYIRVKNNGTTNGNYTLKITNLHTHNYTNSYVWRNGTQHISFCACGDYKSQGHVVSGGSGIILNFLPPPKQYCLLCGGLADIGFVQM